MSRTVSERWQKINAFAQQYSIAPRTAERMLRRLPQLAELDETTVRVFVNLSKRASKA